MDSPVEAVLFDIDDTICEYRRGTEEILPLAFERAGVEPFFTAAEYEARFSEFAEESEDVLELRRLCFAALARERGHDPEQGRAVARAYAEERDQTNVRFREGAREVLDTFAGEYRLAAVTNGMPEMQAAKLDTLGVDHFEHVVHGGYDAPPKPEPDPFQMVLSAIDVNPAHAVYVGNNPETDVLGAQNAGMKTVLIGKSGESGGNPTPSPDFRIHSLSELLDCPWE